MSLTLLLQTVATSPATGVPAQTSPMVAVPMSWGESLMASLMGAFAMMFSAIPRIIGFIIIVLIGWLVASLVAKAVTAVLHAIKFNEVAERIGIADFVRKMGDRADSSMLVAMLVKWLIRIAVLLVAFDVLGLPGVSDVLRQLLLWIPNLVVALVVLVIGGIGARALGNVVRGASTEAGFQNPDTLANVARTGMWVFAIIVAVNQVGIAANLINTMFMGAIGAISLAAGLAFGLGGRDLATSMLDNWYGQAKAAKPKADRAADAARGNPGM